MSVDLGQNWTQRTASLRLRPESTSSVLRRGDDPFCWRFPCSYVSAEFIWMKGSAKHAAAGVGKHSLPIDLGKVRGSLLRLDATICARAAPGRTTRNAGTGGNGLSHSARRAGCYTSSYQSASCTFRDRAEPDAQPDENPTYKCLQVVCSPYEPI